MQIIIRDDSSPTPITIRKHKDHYGHAIDISELPYWCSECQATITEA